MDSDTVFLRGPDVDLHVEIDHHLLLLLALPVEHADDAVDLEAAQEDGVVRSVHQGSSRSTVHSGRLSRKTRP